MVTRGASAPCGSIGPGTACASHGAPLGEAAGWPPNPAPPPSAGGRREPREAESSCRRSAWSRSTWPSTASRCDRSSIVASCRSPAPHATWARGERARPSAERPGAWRPDPLAQASVPGSWPCRPGSACRRPLADLTTLPRGNCGGPPFPAAPGCSPDPGPRFEPRSSAGSCHARGAPAMPRAGASRVSDIVLLASPPGAEVGRNDGSRLADEWGAPAVPPSLLLGPAGDPRSTLRLRACRGVLAVPTAALLLMAECAPFPVAAPPPTPAPRKAASLSASPRSTASRNGVPAGPGDNTVPAMSKPAAGASAAVVARRACRNVRRGQADHAAGAERTPGLSDRPANGSRPGSGNAAAARDSGGRCAVAARLAPTHSIC